MSLGSEIAVGVVANFISDLAKFAAGEAVDPIEKAIAITAEHYPGIEGTQMTLRRWLRMHPVQDALSKVIAGHAGPAEVPVQQLVSALVDPETGFAMLADTEQVAADIVRTFLHAVRTTCWSSPVLGLPGLANRVEHRFDRLEYGLATTASLLVDAVGGMPTLTSALQEQYGHAEASYTQGDYPTAKALFGSLLKTLDISPGNTRELRTRVLTNLARISVQLDAPGEAVLYLAEARRLDPVSPKTRTNWGVALLLDSKPEEALRYLDTIEGESAHILEYWSARAEALVQLGRKEEAISIAQRAKVDDRPAEREHMVGVMRMHSAEYDAAAGHFARALEIDPERPEFLASHAESLLIPITAKANESELPTSGPADHSKLSEVTVELEKARRAFEKTGRVKKAGRVQLTLGVALLIKGDAEGAIQQLHPLSVAADPDPDVWRNLGSAYLLAGKAAEAIAPLERAVAISDQLNERHLLFSAYMLSGRADRALALADDRTGQQLTKDSLPWYLRSAEALCALRKWTAAHEILERARTAFGEDPAVLLQLANYYEGTGEVQAAADYYKRALECAPGGRLEAKIRFLYGGFCGSQHQYSAAIEIWKPLVRPPRLDPPLVPYCVALYNSGQLRDLSLIATTFRGSAVPEKLADIFASTYERLNSLDEAIFWLKYLGDNYGNQLNHLVHLAIAMFRRGQRQEAREVLDGTRHRITVQQDLMNYAKAYTSIEQYEVALEVGLQALKAAPDDADISADYVMLFLIATKSGNISPDDKYITAYQQTLETFQSRFPNSGHIQSIRVQPGDITPMLRVLDHAAKQLDLAVQVYNQRLLPVWAFSHLLGRDVYETWQRLVADDRLHVFSAFGTVEESGAAEALLAGSKSLVVDLVGLFTNAFLGMLDLLSQHATIYVEQATLDELHRLQAVRKVSDQGYMMAGKQGDSYVHYEVSADEAQRLRLVLDQTTEFVERCAVVTGLSTQLESTDAANVEVLGDCNVRTLLLAREKSYPLLTDDKPFAELGRQLYGTSSVNTQAFLNSLLRSGILDRPRYDDAILQLVRAGYTHTSVDAQQIFRTMSKYAFQITPEVLGILQVVEAGTTSMESATRVAAEVLKMLFIEQLPGFTREAVTFLLLETLTRNRNPQHVVSQLRSTLRHVMGILLVLQLAEIESYLKAWEQKPAMKAALSYPS
jgi:tetratricopeptide (TPR) repeat protein